MKDIKCKACGKMIPEISEFCPYCGEIIINEERKVPFEGKKASKMSTVIPWAICIIMIIMISAGVLLYYIPLKRNYESTKKDLAELSSIKADYEAMKGNMDTLKTESDEKDKKITELNDLNTNLKKQIDSYKKQVTSYKSGSDCFDDLKKYLRNSKTSNGIISTNSRIYCVKKGSEETIRVNWPSNGAYMYMGVDDNRVVDVDWKNTNVKVTGIQAGVAELEFGSNDTCTKNRFTVAIICYD